MRLVLDTNVVVSALLWRGTPHKLLAACRNSSTSFYTSSVLLQELAGILDRDKFAKILAANVFTAKDALDEYVNFSHVVKTQPLVRPVCPDPDDDAVLACALAAKADLIVSGDSDLLNLGEYQGIAIVSPAEALKRITVPG